MHIQPYPLVLLSVGTVVSAGMLIGIADHVAPRASIAEIGLRACAADGSRNIPRLMSCLEGVTLQQYASDRNVRADVDSILAQIRDAKGSR